MSDTLNIPPGSKIKDFDDPTVGPGDYVRLGTGNVALLSNVWTTVEGHAVRAARVAAGTFTILPPDAPAGMAYLDSTLRSERLRALLDLAMARKNKREKNAD